MGSGGSGNGGGGFGGRFEAGETLVEAERAEAGDGLGGVARTGGEAAGSGVAVGAGSGLGVRGRSH